MGGKLAVFFLLLYGMFCCGVINTEDTNCGNYEILLLLFSFLLQVSDWWEEYVYLRGRGPIMVNSNYFAMVGKYFKHLICQRSTVKFVR